MFKWLAILAVCLLAVMASPGAIAGGHPEEKEQSQIVSASASGIGVNFIFGWEGKTYSGTLLLDSIAPCDQLAFWRWGSDLPKGRIKNADGVKIHGRVLITGATDPTKFEVGYALSSVLDKTTVHPAPWGDKLWEFELAPSSYGKPGDATPFQLRIRAKDSKKEYVRVIFKITYDTDDIDAYSSLFLETVSNLCEDTSKRNARNMASMYCYYQSIDSSFGGSVTDSGLLAPKPNKEEEDDNGKGNEHTGYDQEFLDALTALINGGQNIQDAELKRIVGILCSHADDLKKLFANDSALLAQNKEILAILTRIVPLVDQDHAWILTAIANSNAAQQSATTALPATTPAASTGNIRFVIAFVGADGKTVAVEFQSSDETGQARAITLLTGTASFVKTGLPVGTTESFKYRLPGGTWHDYALPVTAALQGTIHTITVTN